MAWAIAAQWLQVFSGGPGQPLGWASWAQTGSGAPGPKWKLRGTQGSPTSGPSRDELKSEEDPFGGTGLAGATPFWWGLEGAPGPCRRGGEEEGLSLLPRIEGVSQAGPSQGRPILAPFLRARPPSAPALTWRSTGDPRPQVSMLGRAGMCHYFGWLGTVVLLAVGRMKECTGVTTLAQTLGFWRGPQGLLHWVQCPLRGRSCLLFLQATWVPGGGRTLWDEGGVREC